RSRSDRRPKRARQRAQAVDPRSNRFRWSSVCESLGGIDENSCYTNVRSLGGRLQLVAEAERTAGGFRYRVAPEVLAGTDYLAGTRGAENRLEITATDGAVHRLQGVGAGRIPTAPPL